MGVGGLDRHEDDLLRWRVEGDFDDYPKMVAIVAPHTSNWDFPVGLAARYALRLDASWLGKHTLFRPPFGWIMRRWGGIPVDRTASHDVVSQTIEAFASRPHVFLVITPEGPRKQAPTILPTGKTPPRPVPPPFSDEATRMAEMDAWSVWGVKDVRNEIQVRMQ